MGFDPAESVGQDISAPLLQGMFMATEEHIRNSGSKCCFIHSFSSLSYDRSKASSKASSPHSAIQSLLFQMRVSSPFLKVIQ